MIIDKQYGPFSVLIEDPLRKRKEEPSVPNGRGDVPFKFIYSVIYLADMNAVTLLTFTLVWSQKVSRTPQSPRVPTHYYALETYSQISGDAGVVSIPKKRSGRA